MASELVLLLVAGVLIGVISTLAAVALGGHLVFRATHNSVGNLFGFQPQGSVRSLETDDDEMLPPERLKRSVLDTEEGEPDYPKDMDSLLFRNARFMDQLAADKAGAFTAGTDTHPPAVVDERGISQCLSNL